jgi:hypothetical protein
MVTRRMGIASKPPRRDQRGHAGGTRRWAASAADTAAANGRRCSNHTDTPAGPCPAADGQGRCRKMGLNGSAGAISPPIWAHRAGEQPNVTL